MTIVDAPCKYAWRAAFLLLMTLSEKRRKYSIRSFIFDCIRFCSCRPMTGNVFRSASWRARNSLYLLGATRVSPLAVVTWTLYRVNFLPAETSDADEAPPPAILVDTMSMDLMSGVWKFNAINPLLARDRSESCSAESSIWAWTRAPLGAEINSRSAAGPAVAVGATEIPLAATSVFVG